SVFFFSSRRRHTRFSRDWSSDVCSSDLIWRGLMLGNDDVLRADLIQQLMCQGEIDTRQVERTYDIRFGEYFSDALAALRPLQDDGLVQCPPGKVKVTPRGRALLRIIAMCFDRYLGNQGEGARYSRTI